MIDNTFTCHDCGDTFTFDREPNYTGGTGYAVLNDDATPEHRICYDCSRKRDLADAAETGKLFAYVNSHTSDLRGSRYSRHVPQETIDAVTTWPGLKLNDGPVVTRNTWRSNFGDVRTAFIFNMETGPNHDLESWHGIAYAGDGGYCRLYRNKVQP